MQIIKSIERLIIMKNFKKLIIWLHLIIQKILNFICTYSDLNATINYFFLIIIVQEYGNNYDENS